MGGGGQSSSSAFSRASESHPHRILHSSPSPFPPPSSLTRDDPVSCYSSHRLGSTWKLLAPIQLQSLAHGMCFLTLQIHVDRYKRSIYHAVKTDPFLLGCTTSDPLATRFHACERRNKCDGCRSFDQAGQRTWNTDKRIVHVNMVEVKSATWDIQQIAFREKLGRAACGEAEWPYNIVSTHAWWEFWGLTRVAMSHCPSLTITGASILGQCFPP